MRLNLRSLLLGLLIGYTAISCYTVYHLMKQRLHRKLIPDSKWKKLHKLESLIDSQRNVYFTNAVYKENSKPIIEINRLQTHKTQNYFLSNPLNSTLQKTTPILQIEIWGKAAIGYYVWEHILEGNLEDKLDGIWTFGKKLFGNMQFSFRSGPGVLIDKVPKDTEYLILVLNGREPKKIEYSKQWLDFLPNLSKLKRVAVMLLGNEQCDNEWMKPYLRTSGGTVDFIFLVYDSKDIDNINFYQWPLGVATYRNFPKEDVDYHSLSTPRQNMCNFLGTVYLNSSREVLVNVLEKHNLLKFCNINIRKEWKPQETFETRNSYVKALLGSDLTLCPVGMNSECYRAYEAMSMGSVPIIEDRLTEGKCGPSSISKFAPFRLLKEEQAPVIFIKKWEEITDILKNELTKSLSEKVLRRQNVLQWYKNFKRKLQDRFITIIQERFFSSL